MKLREILLHRMPMFECRQSLELVGGPGGGKSTTITEVARLLSIDYDEPFGLVTYILSGIEAPDVKGFLMPIVDKVTGDMTSRFSRPSVFPDKHNMIVFEGGKRVTDEARLKEIGVPVKGILLLDEFGQADADVQKVSAELLLEKRINGYYLPGEWTVWAASNRVEDKSGVVKRLAFVDNRMCEIIVDPDYTSFENWCLNNGVNPLAITFAKRNPSIVFKDKVPAKGGKFCTPRSLVLSTAMIERIRPKDMEASQLPHSGLAMEWLVGWIGEGDAAVYAEHIALGSKLPSTDEVFKDPEGTEVPDRVDARFVMSANLSMALIKSRGVGSTTGPDKVAAALTYISRFEQELQVVFVRSVVAKAPRAMASPAFADWASANQKLLMAAHAI